MRKLYRNKRALSTVISTILMIMVVMIGMSLLFAYVAVYAQNYKDGIGGAVMESLTIEDISLNSTAPGSNSYGNQVKLWVYNTGKVDIEITSLYVNGIALTNASQFNFNIKVPVGSHVPITVQAPSDWVSNYDYTFKIITFRGSIFEEKIESS
jgi:FlaG/FlaF family flagellin (archaellin)